MFLTIFSKQILVGWLVPGEVTGSGLVGAKKKGLNSSGELSKVDENKSFG